MGSMLISTWCGCRFIYAAQTNDVEVASHNIVYGMGGKGLKSKAAGSGLLRGFQKTTPGNEAYWQPMIKNVLGYDEYLQEEKNFLFLLPDNSPYPVATDEIKKELVGEDVTLANGSVTITNALFAIPFSGQWHGDSTYLGEVQQVGKLETFS
jgi:hypothetical protein